MKYKRILLKLSGESFKGNKDNYDLSIIKKISLQIIKLLKEKKEIAIVIGGGNIWRGNRSKELELDQETGDYVGMIATIMNSIVLSNTLNNISKDCSYIQSKLEINNVVNPFNCAKAKKLLANNKIVIFAGGTGSPYFTTDTTAVLRAIEINADVILMAKNGVDGVYDSDPKNNVNAKFLNKISYDELIKQKLNIIDLTAASLAQGKNIETLIFDINQDNSIYNILNSKIKHTLIYN